MEREKLEAKLKEFEQQKEIAWLNYHRLDAVTAFIKELLEADHEETNHDENVHPGERANVGPD